MAKIVSSFIAGHAVPFVGDQCRLRSGRLHMMLRANQKDRYRLRAKYRQTCLLVMKQWITQYRMGGTVAIRNNRLDALQLLKTGLVLVEVKCREHRIRRRLNAK